MRLDYSPRFNGVLPEPSESLQIAEFSKSKIFLTFEDISTGCCTSNGLAAPIPAACASLFGEPLASAVSFARRTCTLGGTATAVVTTLHLIPAWFRKEIRTAGRSPCLCSPV